MRRTGHETSECRYLLALCCYEMGKHLEAENALLMRGDANNVPKGAAGYLLLGKICKASGRVADAIQHLRTAYAMDPFLWSAFEELCHLGAENECKDLLELNAMDIESTPAVWRTEAAESNHEPATPWMATGAPSTLRGGTARTGDLEPAYKTAGRYGDPSPSLFVTPVVGGDRRDNVQGMGGHPEGTGREPAGNHSMRSTFAAPRAPLRRKFASNIHPRKVAGALFQDEMQTPLAEESRDPTSPVGRERLSLAVSPESLMSPQDAQRQHLFRNVSSAEEVISIQQALGLVQSMAEAYLLLCMYHCQEATEAFLKLTPNHYATGWVLCQVGRAHYEMADYAEAARAFQWARQVAPHRQAGMEYYSTALWHLKRESELMYLARELTSLDRWSPTAWCAMGNHFSLQKDHGAAVRFFQRALQLDENFSYAHALCGHEYFANEDFDKAMACYRTAVRIDARQYNAWFGLGQIYFRQEKYDMAEYHFRRALTVNGRSSVLYSYLGMCLHRLLRLEEALALLQAAIVADPQNPLAKFEKANVLVSEGREEEALVELEMLKESIPKEASIFFQMGKICKRLGRLDKAVIHFNTALDLKPSSLDASLIKSAMEKLHLDDAHEEAEF